MQVLIADDDRKTRELFSNYLLDAGHEPILATRGLDAVRIATELRPPVVILDGLLPELHGFEVARFLRDTLDYRPWIILATAVYKSTSYQSDAVLKYGTDRYLIKPVSREMLMEAVAGSESLIQPRPLFSGLSKAPAGMTGTSK